MTRRTLPARSALTGAAPSKRKTQQVQIVLRGKLTPTQRAFHNSKARYRLFVAGLGSGKTEIGAIEALCAIRPGSVGAITAPTYKMLKDSVIPKVFRIFPEEIVKEYRRGDMELHLIDKSVVLFRSLENYDALRGMQLAWWWMDEAARMTRAPYEVLLGRLRQPGYDHRAWVTTTPRGRNWIWEEWVQEERADYEYFKCATEENRCNLPAHYIESLENTYAGLFKQQELYGEFVEFEGLIYPMFNPEVHLRNAPEDLPFVAYAGGIDWGFKNPTAMVVDGITQDRKHYQLAEVYEPQLLVERDLIPKIREAERQLGGARVTWFCDPAEPQYISMLVQAGINARGAPNDVKPGLNYVATQLDGGIKGEPSLFISPICINTVDEFQGYVWEEPGEGRPEKEKPLKVRDHLMDARRYCSYGYANMGYVASRRGFR